VSSELIIAAIGGVVAIVLGWFKLLAEQRRTHDLVNSRMTELLELTRRSSYAAGRLDPPSGENPHTS
jgi:hypothetical protein